MTEWVRVKDKSTKHEYTVARESVDSEAHDILKDKDAVDSSGVPLPGKPYVSKGESSSTGHKAAEKEGSA